MQAQVYSSPSTTEKPRVSLTTSIACTQVYVNGRYASYVFEHTDGRWYHNAMRRPDDHGTSGFATQDDAVADVVARVLIGEVVTR